MKRSNLAYLVLLPHAERCSECGELTRTYDQTLPGQPAVCVACRRAALDAEPALDTRQVVVVTDRATFLV